MRYRIIIIILIIILAGIDCRAQSDSLMFRMLSLERKIMQAQSDTSAATSLLFEKAMVLKHAGEYDQALSTLKRMDGYKLKDSIRCSIYFQKALVQYLDKNFTSSLFDMWSAQACGSGSKEMKILFLMILLENERWDDFKSAFTDAAKANNAIDTSAFLREFQHPVYFNPEVYARYSKIPARGLFKLGARKQAFTNIALQVVFVGFAASEIYSGFYSTAFFSGLRPAQRFYSGGRGLTESVVYLRNEQNISLQKQEGYCYIGLLYPQ
ncbi:MAG: hypothetical protein WDO14_19195 [Bacteroidota bacterium]